MLSCADPISLLDQACSIILEQAVRANMYNMLTACKQPFLNSFQVCIIRFAWKGRLAESCQ